MRALTKHGVDPYSRRLIHNWLRQRKFRVKTKTPNGDIFGPPTPISAGLPQGGVLSPLLWVLFFNTIHEDLNKLRAEAGLELLQFLDLIFADDITTVVVANTLEEISKLACFTAEAMEKVLKLRYLAIQRSKTQNILFEPNIIPKGLFRRDDRTMVPSTKKRLLEQYRSEATYSALTRDEPLDFDPYEDPQPSKDNRSWLPPFPFPLADEIKILGVTFDRHGSFDGHFAQVLAKARIRQGLLARVSHYSWGLETTILQITHDAVILSLVRYGLAILGSCYPEDLANQMDIQIINTASRKVADLPKTTRIETLHFSNNTWSFRNIFIRHCAHMVHLALTSHNSLLQRRIQRELCAIYQTPTLDLIVEELPFGRMDTFNHGYGGVTIPMIDRIRWQAHAYHTPLRYEGIQPIRSTYYAHAPELRRQRDMRADTFLFAGMMSWLDVGLAVLHKAGWKPECSQAHTLSVEKALPPDPRTAQLFVETTFSDEPSLCRIDEQEVQRGRVQVVAGAITINNVCATAVCLLLENVPQVCHGFVHGQAPPGTDPIYNQEVALLHALRVTKEWLLHVEQQLIQNITIRAGNGLLCHNIKQWMLTGDCKLESAAASGIIHELQHKHEWTTLKMALWPLYIPETFDEPESIPAYLRTFLSLAEHYRIAILTKQSPQWLQKLPAVPLTATEVKEMIAQCQQRDELRVMAQLVQLGSQSAAIVCRLGLTRPILVEALQTLRDERRAQSNLLAVIGATRYKTITKTGLADTRCPLSRCRKKDSFDHMIQCYDLGPIEEHGTNAVQFLVKMARKTQILDEQAPRAYEAPQ